MKRRRLSMILGGLDVIEQAMHALRLASPGTLLCYYVGAAPFVLAALYFWSDMSRSGFAEENLVGGAVGLALLFIWMKLWQSVFALKLSAQLANETPPKINARLVAHAIASQAFLHSAGLFVIPVAANILVPIFWTFGFFQNATVLALREPRLGPLARRSWKQACWAPGPGHAALGALGLFGIFVFFNVAITIMAVPYLVKMLLGIETNSTLSIMSGFNTTFLAASAGLTYLCFDPLVKAVYTVRCFYGQSRATGEDLRVTLRTFQAPALAAALIFFAAIGSLPAAPAPASPASATEQGAQLDRSIDKVLQRPEYTWREPRVKAERAQDERESAIWKRIRASLKKAFQAFGDWLDKLFRRNPMPGGPNLSWFTPQGFVYILIFVAAIAAAILLWYLWRTRSRRLSLEMEATPAAPMPDLSSDDVAGDELPVDGWNALALELLERGDLRLAMRAFYFSSLAHLATRSLVSIAKFKSNRDYERELLRRSHALPNLALNFSENVSIFDRVWYGMHDINAELLQQFRGNVERIRES